MEAATKGDWVVKATTESHKCVNPVRSCEEKYFKDAMEMRDKSKSLIKLSIGKFERFSKTVTIYIGDPIENGHYLGLTIG